MSGGAVRRLRPDAILVDSQTLLSDRALVVRDGRVLGHDGPSAEDEVHPGEFWSAAPVLVHAHLESHDAPAATWSRAGFAAWAAELLAWRERRDRLPPDQAAAASLAELRRAGCGFVLAHRAEAGATSEAHRRARELPELLDLPELFAPEPDRAGEALRTCAGAPGRALHSPFGVSLELARAAFAAPGPVSIHLGEHAEERRLLAAGDGPLAELLRARGRPLPAGRWPSPVDWLADAGGLRPGVLAVHGADLRPEELRRLDRAGVRVVWCPGTHRFFRRPAPAFAAAGLPAPALGCDSRASNDALDPLREFRLAGRLLPDFPPAAWWRAATEGGAEAVGRADLGHLRPGAAARWLRFRAPRSPADAAAACVWLAGEEVRPIGGVEAAA